MRLIRMRTAEERNKVVALPIVLLVSAKSVSLLKYYGVENATRKECHWPINNSTNNNNNNNNKSA